LSVENAGTSTRADGEAHLVTTQVVGKRFDLGQLRRAP
jgi:hypothetical protein